jgi:hypothetical protein
MTLPEALERIRELETELRDQRARAIECALAQRQAENERDRLAAMIAPLSETIAKSRAAALSLRSCQAPT